MSLSFNDLCPLVALAVENLLTRQPRTCALWRQFRTEALSIFVTNMAWVMYYFSPDIRKRTRLWRMERSQRMVEELFRRVNKGEVDDRDLDRLIHTGSG